MANQNDKSAAENNAAASETKPAADAGKKSRATQEFITRATVVIDGEIHGPGATVALSADAHATLAELGAIEGDWK